MAGMARSGAAAAELLESKGARVIRVDQRPSAGVRPQAEESFRDAGLIVLSPGVPADLAEIQPARARGVPVIGDLELASWFLQGEIIGITGSNGKTTTTALTAHILKSSGIPVQVGGNIGTPPCSMVKASRPGQWNVLELSSFQLETIDHFRAHIGALLNITPDHLDRHYSLERYAAAKGRLFENQTADDFAVLNAADGLARAFAKRARAQVEWFSADQPGAAAIREILPLRGRHNLENAMAAAAVARLAGAGQEQILAAIQTFPGVEHRLEFVCERGGVAWYNDSKATNIDATLKALDAFPGGLWVILGGKDKNSDYTPLAAPLKEKACAALLIGAAAEKIAAQLDGSVKILHCGTLDAAVREARSRARKGDTVLLTPACASFDQFENFEHRGREFKRLAKEGA